MDILEYESWNNKQFVEAIDRAMTEVYNNTEQIQKWFADGGKYEQDFAMSDIISALTKGEYNKFLPVGHDEWNDQTVVLEVFANISAIDVMEYNSKDEPLINEIYETYKKIVGGDK